MLEPSGIEWVRLAALSSRASLCGRLLPAALSRAYPLAIDPVHPFPTSTTRASIALLVERKHANQLQELFAVVQVPAVLDRWCSFRLARTVTLSPPGRRDRGPLGTLFGGFRVLGHTVFRGPATPITIDEDDAEDLLQTIEKPPPALHGDAVRLEIAEPQTSGLCRCW